MDPGPPRRYPVLSFLRKALRNWRERHQHPFNFAIHLLGIPLAVSGLLLLFFLPWYWGVGALVFGYVLQYAGHAVEGNDVGEWAAIKRMLGLRYVGIAPGRQQSPVQDSNRLS
jgi:Protein of unknown function (DUF962)